MAATDTEAGGDGEREGEQEGEQRGRSRQEAGGAILEIKCHNPLNTAQIWRRYSEGTLTISGHYRHGFQHFLKYWSVQNCTL